jgi:hypothetical protein
VVRPEQRKILLNLKRSSILAANLFRNAEWRRVHCSVKYICTGSDPVIPAFPIARDFLSFWLAGHSCARNCRPSFRKNKPKCSYLMTQNERFGLVFTKTGSINSGTALCFRINWFFVPESTFSGHEIMLSLGHPQSFSFLCAVSKSQVVVIFPHLIARQNPLV